MYMASLPLMVIRVPFSNQRLSAIPTMSARGAFTLSLFPCVARCSLQHRPLVLSATRLLGAATLHGNTMLHAAKMLHGARGKQLQRRQ
jgi:hypothetical protein